MARAPPPPPPPSVLQEHDIGSGIMEDDLAGTEPLLAPRRSWLPGLRREEEEQHGDGGGGSEMAEFGMGSGGREVYRATL